MNVPLYLPTFDAVAEPMLSCLWTDSSQSPAFCHACMQISIVGNMLLGLRLVAFRPICLTDVLDSRHSLIQLIDGWCMCY